MPSNSYSKRAAWAAGVYANVDFGSGRINHELRHQWRAFKQHQGNAALRNVEWALSFDEWWAIWRESGKWDKRGAKIGQYCMSRVGDTGPYAIGNVFINLASENVGSAHRGKRQSESHRLARAKAMVGNRNGVGKIKSPETRAKLSATMKKRITEQGHWGRSTKRGWKHTARTIAKLREAAIKRHSAGSS